MRRNLFPQNIIALIWDFDKTLIPSYMQDPLFKHFNVDPIVFWDEVNGIADFYKRENGLELISKDSLYLNHILTYVREEIFQGLNNKMLQKLGAELEFYQGLPEFFDSINKIVEKNDKYKKYDIKLEHYIISSGLRQIILGSQIAPFVDGVWGCEFIEKVPMPGYLKENELAIFTESNVISHIGYVIDNTTKTRALFEINKGSNKDPEIDVNAKMNAEDRRIPFQNMIYIADGGGDIPAFSIVKQYGGQTFAVYKPGSRGEFAQVNALQKQARVQSFGPADYTKDSHTYMWIVNAVEEIITRIVQARKLAYGNQLGRPPIHIYLE